MAASGERPEKRYATSDWRVSKKEKVRLFRGLCSTTGWLRDNARWTVGDVKSPGFMGALGVPCSSLGDPGRYLWVVPEASG